MQFFLPLPSSISLLPSIRPTPSLYPPPLSLSKTMTVDSVPTAGISKVTDVDFAYAKTLGCTIKLIGTASVNSDGSLAVFVSPTMVSCSYSSLTLLPLPHPPPPSSPSLTDALTILSLPSSPPTPPSPSLLCPSSLPPSPPRCLCPPP